MSENETPVDKDVQLTRGARASLYEQIISRLRPFAAGVVNLLPDDQIMALEAIEKAFTLFAGSEGFAPGVEMTRASVQTHVYDLETVVKNWHTANDGLLSVDQKTKAYAIHALGYDLVVSGGYATHSGGNK